MQSKTFFLSFTSRLKMLVNIDPGQPELRQELAVSVVKVVLALANCDCGCELFITCRESCTGALD